MYRNSMKKKEKQYDSRKNLQFCEDQRQDLNSIPDNPTCRIRSNKICSLPIFFFFFVIRTDYYFTCVSLNSVESVIQCFLAWSSMCSRNLSFYLYFYDYRISYLSS